MSVPEPLFEPAAMSEAFAALSRVARPSGAEDPARAFVVAELRRLGVTVVHYDETAVDAGQRVIVARREGRGRWLEAEPVVLQAHLDMVTVPDDHIFPLELYRDGPWLRARQNGRATTLGADDGIGVAAMLAVLGDPALAPYPIECLFTVQEETDMGGARGFDPSLLRGRRFINLDSEQLDLITFGSAGGVLTRYRLPLTRAAAPDPAWSTFTLTIDQLAGGHSGLDINRGGANAVKLVAAVLLRLNPRVTRDAAWGGDVRLVSIGQPLCDDKTNVIPNTACAVVRVPADAAQAFVTAASTELIRLRVWVEATEPGLTWTIVPGGSEWPELTAAATDDVLSLLNQVPHGVLRMMPDVLGVVETSVNMAQVRCSHDALDFVASNRSAVDARLQQVAEQHRLIGARFDAAVVTEWADVYPAWTPNPRSPLLETARAVYAQHLPSHTTAVVHAGMECSWAVAKYRQSPMPMDCIAIGPTVLGVHTVDERIDTTTVAPFYQLLCALIHRLFA